MKKIFYDRNALKELHNFSKDVQRDFQAYIEIVRIEGRLTLPYGKKIAKNLFEMRVHKRASYRGFYAYVQREYIVILVFFQKKTKRIPLKRIETAKQRLKQYE
ncbi:MAG: type II toxin-antitoxin system RelE/ParE family toxin [Candidatus Portnoybacteria bacterium]|nr:type II toxin-antitoxin system RelE/ParE family toxin [Candidatus Portnoybacteria bacterium]